MDLFFNELSFKDEARISYHSVVAIARVYRALAKYHITTCRIGHEESSRLFRLVSGLPDSANIRNFYFAFFRTPYESEAVEEKQDDYCAYRWTYHGMDCFGLALAYILDSSGLSIDCPEWNRTFVECLKDEEQILVRNICTAEHVELHIPQMQGPGETELLKCNIPVSDKKIVLRNDHGMDVLEIFSKRLMHSPYLTGVVNSLPYNPYERKFIKRIRESGLIEIVLPCTDEGLGIVVKTTGRTMGETEKIAEIIEEEFGYI